MKKVFVFLVMLCISLAVMGQVEDPGVIKFSWHTAVALLVAFYEAIVRVIPTVKNWSFIGKIIDILAWLSNFLNLRKQRLTSKLSNFVKK